MIIPSLYHLQKFVETLAGRDDEDLVTISLPLGDLRILAEGKLTDDSAPSYTSKDVRRR